MGWDWGKGGSMVCILFYREEWVTRTATILRILSDEKEITWAGWGKRWPSSIHKGTKSRYILGAPDSWTKVCWLGGKRICISSENFLTMKSSGCVSQGVVKGAVQSCRALDREPSWSCLDASWASVTDLLSIWGEKTVLSTESHGFRAGNKMTVK